MREAGNICDYADVNNANEFVSEQTDNEICELGRTVIHKEAHAVLALAARLDRHFAQACRILFQCKGKIIVTGIGKSGHIGRKLAATFASTGSPSFFVHPAEAKHGDMGMITKQDIVIAVSHSGETEEIIFLLPTIKRLGISLISLTGKISSTLGKAAAVNIDVSVAQEACPLGVAPTSSTTAALAMGDALAISLLQMRGFTSEDFALSHPGGMLGRRLLLSVDQIMHKGENVPKVASDALLKIALLEMSHKKLGMTTIVSKDDELLGIFTDGDLRRAFDKNIDVHQTVIHEVMSRNPKVIQSGILAAEALHMMEKYKITALVVLDNDNKIAGVIHMHDLLRAGI